MDDMSPLVRFEPLILNGVWTVDLGRSAPALLVQPRDEGIAASAQALHVAMALAALISAPTPGCRDARAAFEALHRAIDRREP